MTVTWVILANGVQAQIRRQRTSGGTFELVHSIERPRARDAKAFVAEIATELASALTTRRFDLLVLVAEPDLVRMLFDALDPACRHRVRAQVTKDLLGAAEAELARHLAGPNPPVRA